MADFPIPQTGTVIAGTLRAADLLPAFLRALNDLDPITCSRYLTEMHGREAYGTEGYPGIGGTDWEAFADASPGAADGWIEELTGELDALAPPLCYFGSLEGDGSDFGFWVSPEWRQMAEEEPDEYGFGDDDSKPYRIDISDHGNVELYGRRDDRGERHSIWSFV